jgi:hypothetical protein
MTSSSSNYKTYLAYLAASSTGVDPATVSAAAAFFKKNFSETDEFLDSHYLRPPNMTITSGSAVSANDFALDIGYVTFDVNNLTDPILIKALASAVSSSVGYNMIGKFAQHLATPIPDADSLGSEEYTFSLSNLSIDTLPSTVTGISRHGETSNSYITATAAFQNSVDITTDGALRARFSFAQADDEANAITGAGVAASRDKNATKTYYLSEYKGMTFTDLDITGDGFTLEYAGDELIFGKMVYFQTQKQADQGGGYLAALHVVPDTTLPVLLDSNGVTFISDTTVAPANGVFTATEVKYYSTSSHPSYISQANYNSIATITKNDHIKIYKVSLTYGGAVVSLSKQATLRFPIPQGWDTNNLIILRYNESKGEAVGIPAYTVDSEGAFVSVDTEKAWGADAIYCIAAISERINLNGYLDAGDGLYKVGYSLIHYGFNKPSMANASLVDHTGYFDVKDGAGRLYLRFQHVTIGSSKGYLSDVFSRENGMDLTAPKTRAEYLSYLDAASIDENTVWLHTDGRYYSLNYPSSVSMPLFNPDAAGYYWLSFIVPIMDGLDGGAPGSGAAEASSRLLIHTIEKLADGAENPYAGYDKTVIGGAIQDAQTILRNNDANEAQTQALNTAIAVAQAVYDTDPTDEETILATRDALRAAIADLPKAELNAVIASADALLAAGQAGCTADSWTTFTDALNAAKSAAADADATQDEIDGAQSALAAAVAALTVASNADKSALTALIGEAAGIADIGYTPETWNTLQTALINAQTLAGSSDPAVAAQDAVDGAVTALQSAINGLVRTIDTGSLDAAIADARATLDAGASGYEPKSFEALQAALTAAEAAKAGALTAADVIKQAAALTAAKNALVRTAELRVPPANGTYSLAGKTALWNYSQNQASMGNPAIDHDRSYLEVTDSGAKAHLFFRAMTFANLTGHLLEISNLTNPTVVDGILEDWDLVPATVHSWLSETDEFLPQDRVYPNEVSINVTPGDLYTPVFVNVPVMGASANQPARVKIDWSGFDLGTAVNTDGLNAAITQAGSVQASAHTTASYNSLAKSVEAGEALLLLNATQGQTDARAAAITAANAALLAVPVVQIDKTALNAAIDAADIVFAAGRGNRTEASWNAFVSALNAAKAVAENADATQSAVDAALAALTAARTGLADEPPITKAPEATESVAVTPEITTDPGASGEKVKIVESTVSAEAAGQLTAKAAQVLTAAKAAASAKIAAGETVVAEVKLVTALPEGTLISEVKETVTNVSVSAIKSIIAESARPENANVELVLTVESDLGSVTLDGTELAALVQGKDDDAVVSVTVVADARADAALPAAQANVIPADKVPFAIEFTVTWSETVTTVTGPLASPVAVTVPYVKRGGADKNVVLWYVAADGTKTKLDATHANGRLTFVTDRI